MKIFKTIWSFINSRIFPYILIIGVILFMLQQCQKTKELKRQAIFDSQNMAAMGDSLTTVRTKNGSLNTSITAYIMTEKELKEANRELFDEVKDQKGKVLTLNSAVIRLTQDKETLAALLSESESRADPIETINDSTYQIPWVLTYRYDSMNYDIFTGRSEIFATNCKNMFHNRTWLENRETQIGITFGQRVEDDKLRVFVQSKYPGFSTASLQGVLIDPNTNPYIKSLLKPKRWFPGVAVGIGATVGFNVATGGYGLVIGPTVNFGIYNFKK